MLIWIDKNRFIYGINENLMKEEAEQYVNDVDCFWLECELPTIEVPMGKDIEYYLLEDNTTINTILIDLEDTTFEPTQLDRIEAAVNQSKQDIIDEYTLELLESGAL